MKIVHFNHCNLGSAEASTAHVMEFADRLATKGHQVFVVAPTKGKYNRPTECTMIYFPYLKIKWFHQPTAVFSGFIALLRLYKKERFDCLYIRRLPFDFLPGIFSRITKVPLIVETNGQIEINEFEVPFHFLWKVFWYPILRIIEWIVFSAAFAVTADGDERLSKFLKRYPKTPDKFHMIRSGGIDLKKFRRIDKLEAKKITGLNTEKRYCIWVGTIFAWSGLEILITAAQKVFQKHADVDILIIGEGPERKKFEKLAIDLGVAEKIKFTGYIATADLYKWLSASDIALAPYTRLRLDREDFTSYKIFEYLACGLPVVTSFKKGNSNICYIDKHSLGATVPPEDPGAFADALIGVLRDQGYVSDEFSSRARQVLIDMNVTWDSVVDEVEKLCVASKKN